MSSKLNFLKHVQDRYDAEAEKIMSDAESARKMREKNEQKYRDDQAAAANNTAASKSRVFSLSFYLARS